MTRATRFPRRAALAAVLLSGGLLLGAHASTALAGGGVTAVSGSAYGYHAFNVSLFGASQPEVGPTPAAALASDASNSPQSASSTTGLVTYGPATLFSSDGISVQTAGSLGATGSVTSSSSVNNINKAATQPSTGTEALTADNISSSCSASPTGTSGSTTVTNGTLVTDNSTPTVVPVPANPAANTSISGVIHITSTLTDNFHMVFNEQTTDAAGTVTVNAVHEYFDGPITTGNLIIGQVVCGVPSDASISASGRLLRSQVNQPFAEKVATFTDPDPNGAVSDYTATIDWGDGTTTSGAIARLGNGTFVVSGSHVWTVAGTMTVAVAITDSDAATPTTTVTDSAIVHRA